MKKLISILFFSFLLFGIILHAPLVVSDGNDSNSGGNSGNSTTNNSGSSDDNEDEEDSDTSDDDSEDDDLNENACEEISGETFRSIRQYERGLNVSADGTTNGVVLGFWSISFENGQFSWSYSDVVEEGSYICEGDSITGTSIIGRKLTGEYNANEDVLIWDGKEYREKEDDKERDRSRIGSREGCTIKIEKEIKIENRKRVEVIKRKIVCADGSKTEIKIKIENRTEDGRFREKIKYEFRGEKLEVETEEGIDLEEIINGTNYTLRAKLRNGNVTKIKIMPDQASEIALERLRALNFTVELREIKHKNIPRVVYNIEANKHGRFLGVFKLALKVEGQIDPETGEFIGVSKPWWAFLVSGEDSDQTEDETDDEDEEGNETISGNGLVEFVDIEGGCWKIVADDGTSYEPTNLNETFKQDGLQVEFEGEVSEGGVSICQVGTLIELTEIELDIENEENETNSSI